MTGAPTGDGYLRPNSARGKMRTRAPVVALILAAGASTRFGGAPKACLEIDGEAAVARIARISLEVGCSRAIVVAGMHAREIRVALRDSPAEVVVNEEWRAGRTGSVQLGLEALGRGVDAFLWPVDHPFVEDMSLNALLAARDADALAVWYIPMHGGRGGHPVLVRSAAFATVRALRPSAPLREVLPTLGPQVMRVPVADAGVVANVDTPEEFERRLAEWRSRWTGG